jgi:hypothetical protein
MTWPTCTQCGQPYIPIQHVTGCPWCRDKPTPAVLAGESWRERRNRHRREATQARREAT